VPAIRIREVLLRSSPSRPGGRISFLVVSVGLAVSAVYDLVEWAAALSAGGASIEFLGALVALRLLTGSATGSWLNCPHGPPSGRRPVISTHNIMTPLSDLWLPILVSGVAVFFLSALMWMVMPHHKKDFGRIADEDGLMALLRGRISPGQYSFPHCDGHSSMKDPVWQEKQKQGPCGLLYVMPSGGHAMGKALFLSLVHNLAVATFVAYVAAHSLRPGTDYLSVFRIVGTTTILAYCAARFADAIWMAHSWRGVFTQVFDGVVYGLVTAGIFGWLWPASVKLDML